MGCLISIFKKDDPILHYDYSAGNYDFRYETDFNNTSEIPTKKSSRGSCI